MTVRGGALALALVLAPPACVTRPTDPEKIVVVKLGEQECTLADLERYFAANLPESAAERDLTPAELQRVKSRLLDAFIDERLLLGEALRRELTVEDVEIEAWLGFARGDEEVPVTRTRWEETRRQLLIHKLEEDVWHSQQPVSEAEVAERLAQGPRARERRVRLRSLRLPSFEQAEQVAGELRGKRITFDEALVLHGSPTDGIPVELGWGSLRPEHRQAIEGLRRGQISAPVEMAGAFYLFRVEAWFEGTDEGRRAAEARQALERDRRQRAFAALLATLRAQTNTRIETAALPFSYVAPDGES